MKFKVGDKVKMIEMNSWGYGKIGEIYTVRSYNMNAPGFQENCEVNEIFLEEFPQNFIKESRFKKINSQLVKEKLGIK